MQTFAHINRQSKISRIKVFLRSFFFLMFLDQEQMSWAKSVLWSEVSYGHKCLAAGNISGPDLFRGRTCPVQGGRGTRYNLMKWHINF